MLRSIPALELPVQALVVGTAVGMFAATVRYHRTGDLDQWPLIVAYCAVPAFAFALLAVTIALVT